MSTMPTARDWRHDLSRPAPATSPLGMILDAWMDREHVSGARFAARLGMSEASVVRWRNGERSPKISTCRRIAAVTGIPVTRILRAVAEGGE